MVLKREVEDLEKVDEKHRDLYIKGDKGYRLDAEPDPDLSAVQTQLKEVQTNFATVTTERDTFKGENTSLLEKLNAKPPDDDKKTRDVQSTVDKAKAPLETRIKELELSIKVKEDSIKENDVRGRIRRAITENKGIEPILLNHVRSKIKTVERADGQFDLTILDDKGHTELSKIPGKTSEPMAVLEYVSTLKDDSIWSRGFDGSNASGSGTVKSGASKIPAGTKPKSKMTDMEKSEFIKAYGQDAYVAHPFN